MGQTRVEPRLVVTNERDQRVHLVLVVGSHLARQRALDVDHLIHGFELLVRTRAVFCGPLVHQLQLLGRKHPQRKKRRQLGFGLLDVVFGFSLDFRVGHVRILLEVEVSVLLFRGHVRWNTKTEALYGKR
jgi:hypothetical protein